ncbi:hypothetical protein ABK040_011637 [Willaertia magna]
MSLLGNNNHSVHYGSEEPQDYSVNTTGIVVDDDYSSEPSTTKSKILKYGVPIIIMSLSLLTIISVLIPSLYYSYSRLNNLNYDSLHCETSCSYQVVESIPLEMDLSLLPGTNYTYDAWLEMINGAKDQITIACFYSSLLNDGVAGSGGEIGNATYFALVNALKRNVKVTIIQQKSSENFPDEDSFNLKALGAELVEIDWTQAIGGGILHTKAILVDGKHFYVGSANLDWRSLTQVKELGVYIKDCPCLANDMSKMLKVYYTLGSTLKSNLQGFRGWPEDTFTSINQFERVVVPFVNEGEKDKSTVFMSSSPKILNPPYRTNDIDALLGTINNATRIVYISVMDFVPFMEYDGTFQYWPEVEDALKSAVVRNVTVRLLISKWDHTKQYQITFLKSLQEFAGQVCSQTRGKCHGTLDIKLFVVPDPKEYKYPFTRVNHAKYMVNENQAYISTSNWSKDYFYTTGGISFISTTPSLRQTVENIFNRDYNSEFASPLQ